MRESCVAAQSSLAADPQPAANPSFERTSLSWSRKAVVVRALRGQLKAAAQLKR